MRAFRLSVASSVAALGLLGTIAAPALADVCFNAAGLEIVGHAFVRPGRGACRPFTGTDAFDRVASGTACTTTDGTMLRVGYTMHRNNSAYESGQINIPLPSMTGGNTSYMNVTGAGTITMGSGSGSAATCSPVNPPVE